MYCDLNVKGPNSVTQENFLKTVERLIQLGYKGIAITTEVDETVFEKLKKDKKSELKKGPGNIEFPIPSPLDLKDLKTKYPKTLFYNRINISVTDGNAIRKFLQYKEIKRFDLISFQPETQGALKTLTSIAEVDIISYNPENKYDLSLNRKIYNQFVNQNVYFELVYSPAIADSTARRNLMTLSHSYQAIGKSKNVIVSSGAGVPYLTRGPYDVINFNLLFGLNEKQCKDSISRTSEKLLLRARKQKRPKSVIEMVKIQMAEGKNNDLKVSS